MNLLRVKNHQFFSKKNLNSPPKKGGTFSLINKVLFPASFVFTETQERFFEVNIFGKIGKILVDLTSERSSISLMLEGSFVWLLNFIKLAPQRYVKLSFIILE